MMSGFRHKLRVGTRATPLAIAQTNMVKRELMAVSSGALDIELVPVQTLGDKLHQASDFTAFGGKVVFTKELDTALLAGDIDLAVHSVKDMPTLLPAGVKLSAVIARGDVREAFISRHGQGLRQLEAGARLGTISMRRAAQIRRMRPDIQVIPLRGSVKTRLQKVQHGEVDATVLARAGLQRVDLTHHADEIFPTDVMLPAVGQAAIGVTALASRRDLTELLTAINHEVSRLAVRCERSFLRALGGNCRMPIAGLAYLHDGQMHMQCEVLSTDGEERVSARASAPCHQVTQMGERIASEIMAKSSPQLLSLLKHHAEH